MMYISPENIHEYIYIGGHKLVFKFFFDIIEQEARSLLQLKDSLCSLLMMADLCQASHVNIAARN